MDLPRLAARHRGHTTWVFSQSEYSVWKHDRTFGICAALSAEWITHHAQDRNLVESLGGGGLAPLNLGKLREIATLHRTASHADEQRKQLGYRLEMHGVVGLNTSRSVSVHSHRHGRTVAQAQSVSAAAKSISTGTIPNIENDIAEACGSSGPPTPA